MPAYARGSKAFVDLKRINDVLIVDVAAGKVFWKPRGATKFDNRYAGKEAGFVRSDGYVQVRVDDVLYYRHRIICAVANGRSLDLEVDHINGVPGDDRAENLRYVSKDDQQRNLKLSAKNTSGRVGVSRYRGDRWQAAIWSGNKIVSLGRFDSFESACMAREAAEKSFGYHPNHGRVL